MTFIAQDGPFFIEHLDGVEWFHAPVPPADHECWVQTRGVSGTGSNVERCACGAIRNPRWDSWLERNSRVGAPEVETKVPWWLRIYQRLTQP